MTLVYLIRHGETEWNREGRYQGQRDIPLSAEGIRQAKSLAEHLTGDRPDAVYASDLVRARRTAQEIAEKHGLKVICFPEFRERCGGEWEGRLHHEVARDFPDFEEVRWNGGKYGVEPTEAVQNRFVSKLEELVNLHPEGKIFIVAHGMCIAAALSVLTGGEYGFGKTRLHNSSMTRLRKDPEAGWTLLGVNETPHLERMGEEDGRR
ncbi:histidine phosphatase family protein [Staphylospora marina]|uniref:histidine phosphatase family protein n=1 Tax=Staphylospora marina TaxID=2490858 RepID=UPI0013DE397B|nr:histidine phosphatase family protein [Staphylospora marina]